MANTMISAPSPPFFANREFFGASHIIEPLAKKQKLDLEISDEQLILRMQSNKVVGSPLDMKRQLCFNVQQWEQLHRR